MPEITSAIFMRLNKRPSANLFEEQWALNVSHECRNGESVLRIVWCDHAPAIGKIIRQTDSRLRPWQWETLMKEFRIA